MGLLMASTPPPLKSSLQGMRCINTKDGFEGFPCHGLQVHYMISKDSNSSDELMLKALRKKLHVVGRAVDGSLEGSAGISCPPLQDLNS